MLFRSLLLFPPCPLSKIRLLYPNPLPHSISRTSYSSPRAPSRKFDSSNPLPLLSLTTSHVQQQIIDLFGPLEGRQNDLVLVAVSGIVAALNILFALGGIQHQYRCFGDSIYTISLAISRRYRSMVLSPQQVSV